MIQSIILKRFKKFEDVTVDLRPFTVLMGENNSGKTTILQAINLALLILARQNLIYPGESQHTEVRKTGVGSTTLPGISISHPRDLFYGKVFSGGRGGGSVPALVELVDDAGNRYKLAIRSWFGAYNVKCTSSPEDLARDPALHARPPLYISGFVGLRPEEEGLFPKVIQDRLDAGLVSEVLRNLLLETKKSHAESFERLSRRLQQDFNFRLGDVRFDPVRDSYITALYDELIQERTVDFPFNVSGSGSMQILQILAPIYRFCPEQADIVLLDEPDAHLHPNLQSTLAKTLHEIQSELNIQIIVSTHSTSIIRATHPSDVVPVSARCQRCKPLATTAQVEEQIATALDTYDLGKSVISGKLLFVEDADTSILEAFDRTLGTRCFFGANTVPILRGRGKDDKVPFQIGEVLRNFVGRDVEVHFIRDRDGLPDDIIAGMRQLADAKGLRLHFLSLYEIESYLLAPDLVRRALQAKYPQADPVSGEDIGIRIKEALRDTVVLSRYDYGEQLTDGIYKSSVVTGDERYGNRVNAQKRAKELRQEYESKSEPRDLAVVGMGKEALRIVLCWLNEEKKLNLSKDDLLRSLTPEDVPVEIGELLETVRSDDAVAFRAMPHHAAVPTSPSGAGVA